ncbi:MAG: tRNA pseudouridine(38-40) synthase TruA [Eggerthellaceae bacterium]|nr:tRNA pseudouridine(38-40) synthase TruA [Eggerthellaceae bacterium]
MDDARTYSITLAYDGAPFAGFARQPGQLTVQGELEQALSTLLRMPVETTCAGRTDTGVHARTQVVSFSASAREMASRNPASFIRSMNALTQDGISVRALDERPEDFSARFSAKMREYRYFIFNREYPPIFTEPFAWHVKRPLDVDAMQEAAAHLIGEHDFKSFCMAASAEGKRTYRYVDEVSFFQCEQFAEPLICIKVRGNAFLHSMVRAMVGTLVAVGRGQRKPSWTEDVLEAKTRSAAGENAPAKGLVLWDVEY